MNLSNRLCYYVALVRFYLTPWDGIHTKPQREAFEVASGSRVQPVDPWPKTPEPKPVPEPSCFARGVAKLWEKGEGWKVSYTKKTQDVVLRHGELDITIALTEALGQEKPIKDVTVSTQGDVKIWYWYSAIGGNQFRPSREDYEVVKDAILARPYMGLKTRIERKAKQEAERRAKLKTIEELGCPTQSVTYTSSQPSPTNVKIDIIKP